MEDDVYTDDDPTIDTTPSDESSDNSTLIAGLAIGATALFAGAAGWYASKRRSKPEVEVDVVESSDDDTASPDTTLTVVEDEKTE